MKHKRMSRQGIAALCCVLLLCQGLTFTSAGAQTSGAEIQVTFSSEYLPKDHLWITNDLTEFVKYQMDEQESLTMDLLGSATAATVIEIDPETTYQTMRGIGTSMEGTTCANLWALTKEARTAVLRQWFDPETGCGYDWVRLCCGTSDFSDSYYYSYDDVPGDTALEHFSIQEDIDRHIPEICQEILEINPDVTFLMSPWSPPAWMKSNNMSDGGKLLKEYYEVCARYYAKAVQAYEDFGIPIAEFTTNNETRFAAGYPSCVFSVDEEVEFAGYLKKAFKEAGLDTKVLILDHNPEYASQAIQELDLDTEGAIDGVAFHDYGGDLSNMQTVLDAHPETELYFTERSVWGTEGANRIIQYMRNGCNSYQSWVSMCDTNQQPNIGPYQGGAFDPTLALRVAGSDSDYWFTPETYLIGQFAKFIDYGGVRIASDYGEENGVSTLGVLNPDQSIALVAVNRSSTEQTVTFTVKNKGQFTATIPAKTVATYDWYNLPLATAPIVTPDSQVLPEAGEVLVTIENAEPGATVRYTTDGSTPTEESTVYTAPFNVRVDNIATVKARTFREGMANSPVTTVTYRLPPVADPTFSVEAGRYYEEQMVRVSCATLGATIWCSVNGGEYAPYTGPVLVEDEATITVYATKTGMSDSEKVSARYQIVERPVWFQNLESETGFSAGASASVEVANEDPSGIGKTSVVLTVTATGDPGSELQNVRLVPQNGTLFDASEYTHLLFDLKDMTEDGNRSFRATFVDVHGAVWSDWVNVQSVSGEWARMSVPLSMVSGVNLARITEIRIGEYNEGTYLLDNFFFAEGAQEDYPDFSSIGGNENQNDTWVRYEAEDAVVSEGAVITRDNSRFSNRGFVGEMNTQTVINAPEEIASDWSNVPHVRFTVEVEKAGVYELTIGYATETSKVTTYLRVGDQAASEWQKVELERTGSWDTVQTAVLTVELPEGTGELWMSGSVQGDRGGNWVNYDYIELSPAEDESPLPDPKAGAGDVNDDGKVDSSDARLALQHAVEAIWLTPAQITRGDMDENGIVDSVDARQMLQKAVQ